MSDLNTKTTRNKHYQNPDTGEHRAERRRRPPRRRSGAALATTTPMTPATGPAASTSTSNMQL
eukprot:5427184-Prymnesium_polylepis.1